MVLFVVKDKKFNFSFILRCFLLNWTYSIFDWLDNLKTIKMGCQSICNGMTGQKNMNFVLKF